MMTNFSSILIQNIKSYVFPVLIGFVCALIVFVIFYFFRQDFKNNNILSEANKAYDLKLYSKSFDLYLEAQKLHPHEKLIYIRLAYIAFRKGLNDLSFEYFNKFIELGGELDSTNKSIYGQLLFERKDYKKVIELFENNLEVTDVDIYILANVYLNLKDIENYKIKINKISNYQEPFWDLQVFEKNIDNLYSNLNIIPQLPSIGFNIRHRDFRIYSILITKAKNQKDLGNIDYAELLKLAAFVNLGNCIFVESDLAKLRNDFKNKKLSMEQLDLLEGKCANFNGDWSRAISLIEPLLNWDKTNIEYREELAFSYYLKGDRDMVFKIYEEILLIEKNSRISENYAFYFYQYGLKKDALDKLKDAFNLSTESIDKKRLSKNILKISVLDLNDLNICINTEFDAYLDLNDVESLILKSICDLKNNRELEFFEPSYIFYYFNGIKNNDLNQTNQALEKDPDGLLIKYHLIISQLKI